MDSVDTGVRSPPDSAHADDAGDMQIITLMAAAQQVDRCKVLTFIGHPHPTMPPIGDVLLLTPIVLPDTLDIERRDVPWLHVGSGNHCEGAKLYRFNRRVVSVPCFMEPQPRGICCSSCHEIFGQIGTDDVFRVVKSQAPYSVARYKPGAGVAFWRIPAIVESMAKFQLQVIRVESTCTKYKFEQPDGWPPTFKDFVRDLFVTSGVVLPNSISFEGRRGRTYPRSEWDERLIAGLADRLVTTWLRLMWVLPPDRFERAIDDLVENAEKWETSMINCVQAVHPLDPVFLGTANAADFLCSGFAYAARWIDATFAARDADDSAELGVFSWGPGVELATAWAVDIPECKRPDRRASLRSLDPPSLPNDFLLSGSTMVDTQSTAYPDSASQHSSFGTPSQSTAAQPVVEAAEQDPPKQTGFFVVSEGPRAGIFSDPAAAAIAAAGTSKGMNYVTTKQEAERILKAGSPVRSALASQSAADASTAVSEQEDEGQPPTQQDSLRESGSDAGLASVAPASATTEDSLPKRPKLVAFAPASLPWRRGAGGGGRGGRGHSSRRGRPKGRARGGKNNAPRKRSASRNRVKPALLRRLDIAELNNDDVSEFRAITREGGAAVQRAVAVSDFSYSNFDRWRRTSRAPKWYVVSRAAGIEVTRTFREAHEKIEGDTMAKFREFDTKKEAEAYAVELRRPTAADATCFVAFFEEAPPRICAKFALAQAALSEGALDFKQFRDEVEAAEFIKTAKKWWAVLAGTQTGALGDDAAIAAMSGFPNPRIRGPYMSKRTAQKVFEHYSQYAPGSPERRNFAPMPAVPPIDMTVASAVAPAAPIRPHIPVSSTTVPGRQPLDAAGPAVVSPTGGGGEITSPTADAWELAFQDNSRVVFAVRDGNGTGAVHFDCLKLDSRISEPKVFLRETLWKIWPRQKRGCASWSRQHQHQRRIHLRLGSVAREVLRRQERSLLLRPDLSQVSLVRVVQRGGGRLR